MICPACSGKKVVPFSKKKRHLTKPCEECAGAGEVVLPPGGGKSEDIIGLARISDPVPPPMETEPPDRPADEKIVIDMAAIMRALGSWATPRN